MVQSMKKSNGGKRIIKLSKKYKGGRVAFPIKYYGGLESQILTNTNTNTNMASSKTICIKGGGKKKSKKSKKKKKSKKTKKIKKNNSKNKSKKRSNKILRNNNLQRKKVNYNMKKWFNLS
jgi:hypothetical protein